MKSNLRTTLIAFMAILILISCKDDSQVMEDNLDEFTSITIPSTFQTNTTTSRTSKEIEIVTVPVSFTLENGKVVKGNMRFTMPATNEESLIDFEISSNLLGESGLSIDFWSDYYSTNSNGRVESSSCIADCQARFTDENGDKIKGRGGCKAECWVRAVAPMVAAAIGAAAAILTS